MESNTFKKNILKFTSLLLFILTSIYFYNFYKSKKNNKKIKILEYNVNTDKEDLLKIFDDNFYWLICGMERKDYNFDETLSTLRYASRAKFISKPSKYWNNSGIAG